MRPDAAPVDFRSDINGLRALAISLVVAFHAFPAGVPGGFVGVDVFFVISGYLISRIVLRGLANDSFDFGTFYGRRALRLMPALLLMLGVTLAFGWISLYSFEFESLGKHALGALAFASNFVSWNEAGYFDAAAIRKPLVHLWSLAVEEQFYLAFPALLWAARRRRWRPERVIGVALLLSFAINLHASRVDLVGDFFNWEILLGSLLAAREFARRRDGEPDAMTHPGVAQAMSVGGLSLIAFAAFAFDATLRFPGWLALIPTTGAALLIASGPRALIAERVLANRVATWLGRISYPLYLWHWPVLSFAALLQPAGPTPVVEGVAVALGLALATLTFLAIERPLAAMRRLSIKRWLLATPAAAIALLALMAFTAAGFPTRPAAVAMHRALPFDEFRLPARNVVAGCDVAAVLEALYAHCQHDSRGPARYALLGDSKAASLSAGLFSNEPVRGYWLFAGGYKRSGTPVPVLSDAPEFELGQPSLRPALAAIAADPAIRVVVLAAATRSLFVFPEGDSIGNLQRSAEYPAALDGLGRVVATLVDANKKVVLLVDNPTFRDPVLCVSRVSTVAWVDAALHLRAGASSCEVTRAGQILASARYRRLLDEVAGRYPHAVRVFDMLDELCDPVTSICSAVQDGHPLYSYSDHISPYAARKVAARLVPFVDALADER